MHLECLCFFDCQVDFDVANGQRRELVNLLRSIALYKSYYYYCFFSSFFFSSFFMFYSNIVIVLIIN